MKGVQIAALGTACGMKVISILPRSLDQKIQDQENVGFAYQALMWGHI